MSAWFWLLVAYGICYGVRQRKLPAVSDRLVGGRFEDDAEWAAAAQASTAWGARMLRCSYCTGFHAGWIAGLTRAAHELATCEPTLLGLALSIPAWGMAGAAWCYAVDTVLAAVES